MQSILKYLKDGQRFKLTPNGVWYELQSKGRLYCAATAVISKRTYSKIKSKTNVFLREDTSDKY